MIVKVCGITRPADAVHAVQCGATAVGFVFWPRSPRCIRADEAAAIIRQLPQTVTTVGVFVNQAREEIARIAAESGVTTIQLHGDEPATYAAGFDRPIWRAVSLPRVDDLLSMWPLDTTILLDAHDPVHRGGTGHAVDWSAAASVAAKRRVVLAGGLTPENVAEAIATVRPVGVDVSSGVEEAPGVKNLDKIARFVERARAGLNGH